MVPQPYRFSLCFLTKVQYGNLTILGEGYAAIQRMGRLSVAGGWGQSDVMTNSASFVTTQSVAFKYVMASEPYRYT